MEYIINGCKIVDKRRTVETGISVMEGLVNSFIIKENEIKEEKKNDKLNNKEQK